MHFPTHQHEARQNTAVLVGLLAAGVVAIVAAVTALLTVLLAATSPEVEPLGVVAVVAPGTAIVVVGASMVKSGRIRHGGGSYIATSMGGRRIDATTDDLAERRLWNVVEEIGIASGTPMPAVFVLDDEPSINAFAAGWTADDAAIGVTRGALDHLDRRELQGVVAHELGHVANGDTRIKTRIVGWVFGIAVLTVLGRVLLHQLWWAPRRRDRRDGSAAFLIAAGLGLLVVGSVGAFFARLVQAAVSRQREYLADASAVEYTRDPSGLGGALMKIGGFSGDSRIRSAHATEASHLFFTSAFGGALATHPPLTDRIRRLVPSWDGRFVTPATADEVEPTEPEPSEPSAPSNDERYAVPRGAGRRPPRPPLPWMAPPPGHRPPPPHRRRPPRPW